MDNTCYLNCARINIELLKESAQIELERRLNQYNGFKAIVWDDKLLKAFGHLANINVLKSLKVTQIIKLESESLPSISADIVIYFIRPKLSLIKMIRSSIEKSLNALNRKEIHVLFMPRKKLMYEKILTNLNIFNQISSVEEYPIYLFPIDSDLISMELNSSFKEITCDKDYTCIYYIARAIMNIQSTYGIITNICGQGPAAKKVYDLLLRMRKELDPGQDSSVFPQINHLLLIDRGVDLISPLLTQMNYEGLLDEVFGIENSTIKIPQKLVQKKSQDSLLPSSSLSELESSTKLKQLKLNSSDELFAKIRDKTFYEVGPIIKEKCDCLSARYDERHQAKTITEIKQFVENLSSMELARASIANQIPAAEMVKKWVESEAFIQLSEAEEEILIATDSDKVNSFIEDCIAKQEPLIKVLRLICLQSITSNGLKPKVLEFYTSEIIQTYGFKNILFLNKLTKAGLLKEKTSYTNKNYNILKKNLKLVPEKSNNLNHRDISYVFNGYAPLSVRLAENLINPGWKAISDTLKLLPQPTIEAVQQLPSGLKKRRNSVSSIHSCEDQKVILVFFIGGVTFSEISALRLLSQREESNTEFVIATTHFINGKTFLSSLNEYTENE